MVFEKCYLSLARGATIVVHGARDPLDPPGSRRLKRSFCGT
ncbi:hypothetical protein WMF27_26685 [Sorangium sp. So ce281]